MRSGPKYLDCSTKLNIEINAAFAWNIPHDSTFSNTNDTDVLSIGSDRSHHANSDASSIDNNSSHDAYSNTFIVDITIPPTSI